MNYGKTKNRKTYKRNIKKNLFRFNGSAIQFHHDKKRIFSNNYFLYKTVKRKKNIKKCMCVLCQLSRITKCHSCDLVNTT